MIEYRARGGAIDSINGEIFRWGVTPHKFVMANDHELAQRWVLADKSLPFWVREFAESKNFIPIVDRSA